MQTNADRNREDREEREELLNALQAAWYVMIKFAEKDCQREIKTAQKLLKRHKWN